MPTVIQTQHLLQGTTDGVLRRPQSRQVPQHVGRTADRNWIRQLAQSKFNDPLP
jgi:hypothetical protein